MKTNLVAIVSSFCLCLFAGNARADLEPFSLGASETISHDSNVGRTDDNPVSDWYATTELRGAVNQALGRDQLVGTAAINYTDYRRQVDKNLDAFGYRGALELDWSTIGDLSGSVGADAQRRRYNYGLADLSGSTQGNALETDSHAFAKVRLGGNARWNVFAGFDANRRRFTGSTFVVNDEQQWSQNLGTTYSTSPDLSFGVTGNYVRGQYPNYATISGNFSSKSLSATTKWQASGNSSLNGSVGYTKQNSDLQAPLHFVNGSLSWNWAPPSHFGISAGVSRSTNGGVASGSVTSLNDRSLNTTGSLNVTYSLTAKVNLVAGAQYIHRKYDNVAVPELLSDGSINKANTFVISGASNTSRFTLAAHYLPTRNSDLSCSVAHEARRAGSAQVRSFSSNYLDNLMQCAASINFD